MATRIRMGKIFGSVSCIQLSRNQRTKIAKSEEVTDRSAENIIENSLASGTSIVNVSDCHGD